MEIEANGAQDAKNISEQAAAIRSLKTNLCLAILFAIPLILLIKFKADIQMNFFFVTFGFNSESCGHNFCDDCKFWNCQTSDEKLLRKTL